MSDDEKTVGSPPGNNGKAPDGKFIPGNAVGHRFARGNKYGKGNPIAIKQHEGRMEFLGAIHEGTLPALAKKLQVAALEGDMEATKLLLGYCLGRPQQAVELTGADGERFGDDGGALAAAMMAALAPFPDEVRYAVAAALKAMVDRAADRG